VQSKLGLRCCVHWRKTRPVSGSYRWFQTLLALFSREIGCVIKKRVWGRGYSTRNTDCARGNKANHCNEQARPEVLCTLEENTPCEWELSLAPDIFSLVVQRNREKRVWGRGYSTRNTGLFQRKQSELL